MHDVSFRKAGEKGEFQMKQTHYSPRLEAEVILEVLASLKTIQQIE